MCVCRYSTRKQYVEALRRFRLEELACPVVMNAVRCGMASVLPLQLLKVLTAQDLSLRVCGLPTIDLEYLKVRPSPLLPFPSPFLLPPLPSPPP